VSQGLDQLFRYAYLKNCEIEEEELTQEDYDTLDDLDSVEILENFKDLVCELLNTKKEFKGSDKNTVCKTNE
jgi:hypothetical protein